MASINTFSSKDQIKKSIAIIAIPALATLFVSAFIVIPWIRRIDLKDPVLSFLASINSSIWLLVVSWSFYHITFQLTSLFVLPQDRVAAPTTEPKLLVLYLTCNDFQEESCLSCVRQQYSTNHFQILICDDSDESTYLQRIDQFVCQHPEVMLIRRPDRRGYKAGNLNHAIRDPMCADKEWLVIVDADEICPPDYLSRLAPIISSQKPSVAFVQAGHDSDHRAHNVGGSRKSDATRFQVGLGLEIPLFYERDLALRENFGFVLCLGHGVAVRRAALEKIGGFPEVVSEDFAFALEARNHDFVGVYACSVQSFESFPKDLGAFLVRLGKFAAGSAELVRKHLGPFLIGRASIVEKVDFLMLVMWYFLMPLVVGNAFLSAYVCHRLWELRIAVLHPLLPYLFVTMFLLPVPVLWSISDGPWSALRFWFWSVAIYCCCLPIAASHFIIYLIWPSPAFKRTPKDPGNEHVSFKYHFALINLGIIAILLSWHWWSPFSWVLLGYGLSYISLPLYCRLNNSGGLGRLSRGVIWLPGMFLLIALWEMWSWATISLLV